jgi:PAS domain S-box-containing protein
MAPDFPLDLGPLRRVLDYLNVGVYITDCDRRILLWNRKAEEITGYRADEVVGLTCSDDVLVHVDKNQQPLCTTELCPLHRAITLGKENDEPILVFARKKNGQRVAVSVSVAPLRDEAGVVVGGIETFRDETRRIFDLEFARKVQRQLHPTNLPQTPELCCDARWVPCELLGGDFYDVRPIDAARYGVMVADVSGHGVSAALYTVWLKSLCENRSELAAEPAAFLAAISRDLRRVALEESFATGVYAVVEPHIRRITYAGAGHPPPLHFRADGSVGRLETHGLPLGVFDSERYGSTQLCLEPGDLLLCYTDGATEVGIQGGGMLGIKGLAELVRGLRAEGTVDGDPNLLDRLLDAIRRVSGDVALADDVLLLSLLAGTGPAEFQI